MVRGGPKVRIFESLPDGRQASGGTRNID
jgi:hypothetical protein